jgi:hypothetical protein
MKVGRVTDLFCKTVWEARAPSSGVVLYVCAVPSMKKGDTIAKIGVVASKASRLWCTAFAIAGTKVIRDMPFSHENDSDD